MTYSLLATGFLKSAGGVLLAVLILLAMITIHEFGHYLVGKKLGFRITEFSIGFGPALYQKRSKRSGELFALRLIPLGGYCAFDGEDETDESDEVDEKSTNAENDGGMSAAKIETKKRTDEAEEDVAEVYPTPQGARFNEQAPWKRILVLLAGATMNYLLALCLIFVMFGGLGRPLYRVEKLFAATEETQTVTEGLEVGDVVKKIDGKNVYMITDYISEINGKKQGDAVAVTVLRDGKEQTVALTLVADADIQSMTDTGTLLRALGVQEMRTVTVRGGFFETIGNAFAYSFKLAGTVLQSLGELLTGKLAITDMGGPVTTIKVTAQASASGLLSFLNIAALIGVNLAVFNLLPVPALDGCKIIFCLIEWLRGKPVNRKVESIIHFVGIIFLFGFAILVDVLQWIL